MISQKIIRGILSLFVMVSLASDSLYAIRPEATKASEVLTELRSELRSESATYDYEEIRDANIREFVSGREEEIKKVLKRDFKFLFSGFRLDTLSKPAATVSSILQKAFFDELVKKASLLHNNSSVTIPVIKEDPEAASQIDFVNLKAHPWLEKLQVKPTRTPLKAMVFFYEPRDIPFHTIQFEGQSYEAPVRVPLWTFPGGVLAVNTAFLMPDPSVIYQELVDVLWFPQVLFHWDLEPLQAEIRPQPPRQAYTYEDIRNTEIQPVARDQEWEIQRVLSLGLTSILLREFRFTAPHELQNAMDEAIWGQLPMDEAILEIKKMLEADKNRRTYLRKMTKVRKVLKEDWEILARDIARFKLYFSGFSFDSQSDRQIRMGLSSFLEVLGAHEFFKARAVQVENRITIPLLKDTPQDVVYGGKTVDLKNLWREEQRVPLSSILFYAESDESSNVPLEQVQLAGKIYMLPRGVPLWTFPDGVLALNITRASEDVASVFNALGMALRRYKPSRSEVRKAGPQLIVHRPQAFSPTADRGRSVTDFYARRFIQVPDIPAVENGKVLSGRSAFGIQNEDAFGIDLKLIRTQYDLAVLFAIFNHFPFVVVGNDEDDPIVKSIQAINAKRPSLERVVLASSVEEAIQLLEQKKADQMRRHKAYRNRFIQTRLILSNQSSLDAVALKKQLGNHGVVQTTTLDQFSQTAFGVVNRSDLASFADELQQRVLSQFLTAESA